MYRLIGPDGREVLSETPGTLGGHRKNKIYGRLDCAGAARWIAKGHYVKQRVFFADEATAVAAGYRPCANCLPEAYAAWKARRWGTAAEVVGRFQPRSRRYGAWPPRSAVS
jgi:methylphosphotriester-DNA--protein-cysteine methyltransferase